MSFNTMNIKMYIRKNIFLSILSLLFLSHLVVAIDSSNIGVNQIVPYSSSVLQLTDSLGYGLNISSGGNVTSWGNITAPYFFGSGAYLTGLANYYPNITALQTSNGTIFSILSSLSANLTSIGNWSQDKPNYASIVFVNAMNNLSYSQIATNIGNWSADKSTYATLAYVQNYVAQVNNLSYLQIANNIGNYSLDRDAIYTNITALQGQSLAAFYTNITNLQTNDSLIFNNLASLANNITAGSGNITGNMTTDYLQVATSGSQIGNSIVRQTGSTINITGNLEVTNITSVSYIKTVRLNTSYLLFNNTGNATGIYNNGSDIIIGNLNGLII